MTTRTEMICMMIIFISNVVVLMVNMYMSKEISGMLDDLNKVWDDVRKAVNILRGMD